MSPAKQFYLLTALILGAGLIWLASLHAHNARRLASISMSSALIHLGQQSSVKVKLTGDGLEVYDPAAIKDLDWTRFFPTVIESSEVFVSNEPVPVNSQRIVCAAKYWRYVLILRGDGQVIQMTQEALAVEIDSGRMTSLDEAIGKPAW